MSDSKHQVPSINEFVETVRTCRHWFKPEWILDEHGYEGRVCQHCSCFVDRDLAMHWAPFICDGFVDIVEPAP